MKRGLGSQGYTIVEVMMFLAVSGALFASVVLMFNGRVQKTQFFNSVQELDAQIRAVASEVAAGNYPATNNFSCSAMAGNAGVSLTTLTAREQGKNTDCIFLGKVLQFGAEAGECSVGAPTQCEDLNVFSIVGLRQVKGAQPKDDKEVVSYSQARPRALAPQDASEVNVPNLTQLMKLKYGLHVKSAYSGASEVGAVAFFQGLGSYDSEGGLQATNQKIRTIPITTSRVGESTAATASRIASYYTQYDTATVDEDGVILCLEGNEEQKASIVISSKNRQVATDVLYGEERIDPRCR